MAGRRSAGLPDIRETVPRRGAIPHRDSQHRRPPGLSRRFGRSRRAGESVLIGCQFDIVFLGSLLIHLRDPIGALMRAQSVCKDVLIATTPILHENKSDQPLIRFSRPFPGSIDWWLPNFPCYEHWFLAAGFSEVDAEHKYRQEADSLRPNPHGELTRTPILLQIAKARI